MQEVLAHCSAIFLLKTETDCLHSTQNNLPSWWKIACSEFAVASLRDNCLGLLILGFLCTILCETLQIRYTNRLCIFANRYIARTIGFVISLSSWQDWAASAAKESATSLPLMCHSVTHSGIGMGFLVRFLRLARSSGPSLKWLGNHLSSSLRRLCLIF